MMYRKYIPLMLVSILLCTSISAVAGARITLLSNAEIKDTGTIECVDTVFPSRLGKIYLIYGDSGKNYYPDPETLPDKFKEGGLRVAFTAKIIPFRELSLRHIILFFRIGVLPIKIIDIKVIEEPKLEFDISVKDSFLVGESIPVTATLTNKGKNSIKVLELDPYGNGHFDITDPNGEKLHYMGPIGCLLRPIILEPGESVSIVIDSIMDVYGYSFDQHDPHPPGDYTIQGQYSSGAGWPPEWNWTGIWEVSLESPVYNFTIQPIKQFSIDSPDDGDVVTGRVMVCGYIYSISSLPSIKKIWVSIDRGPWHEAKIYGLGVPNPSNQIAVWEYTWDTAKYNDGEHRIGVMAWNGVKYIYDSIHVTVDNKPESYFSIISPFDGDVVSGVINITVSFSNFDPNKVEVRIDDGEWNEIPCIIGCSAGCPPPSSGYPCTSTCFGGGTYIWDTTEVQDGEHRIEARLNEGDDWVYDSIYVTVDNEDDIADYYYLDESDNGITLYLKIGDRINLTLVTNPSTGYRWELDTFDKSVICLINDYCWGYPQIPDLVGYSIKRTWIFEAVGNGHTTLQLKYWQPWSGGHMLKTYILDVIVGMKLPHSI